jgi:NADPH-dependent curcumin reductase CurA
VEAAEQAAAQAAEARVAVPQSLTAPEGEARAAVTAPEGLIGLFEGRNSGKMLIHVAD